MPEPISLRELRERVQQQYQEAADDDPFKMAPSALLALVEADEAATEARDALAGLVVMLGSGQGDPMGAARKHFLSLDAALARFDGEAGT